MLNVIIQTFLVCVDPAIDFNNRLWQVEIHIAKPFPNLHCCHDGHFGHELIGQ